MDICHCLYLIKGLKGFPGGSAGKESACNAENTNSIPGSGRSPGEGIGYPLHYSQGSLEEGMAIHSSNLTWRISMDRGAWWAI